MAHEGPGDEDLLALAAGQVADELVLQGIDIHLFQAVPDDFFMLQVQDLAVTVEDFPDRNRELAVQRLEALGHIGPMAIGIGNGPPARRQQAQDEFDERTLAAAVFTDDGNIVAVADGHVDIF